MLPWGRLWPKRQGRVDHGVPVAPAWPQSGTCFLSQEQGHWGKGGGTAVCTQVSSCLEVVTWLGQAPGQGPKSCCPHIVLIVMNCILTIKSHQYLIIV